MSGLALRIFRGGLEEVAGERMLGPRGDVERRAILAEAEDHARSVGAAPCAVLQVNPVKTRAVLLCEHPRYGRSILKSVSRHAPAGTGPAHVETLRLAHAVDPALFPALYELGAQFSLEQCVEGETLHALASEEWQRVDLVDFFARLRGFGTGAVSQQPIEGEELGLVAFRFVRMILRASRYAVRGVKPWPVMSFARSADFNAALDALLAAATTTRLPRSLVFGDLAPSNVMLDRETGALRVVDVEHMREGFFGFDALWLIAMLTRSPCPAEVLEAAYRAVREDSFTGVEGGRPLMAAMLDVLLVVLGAYVGRYPGRHAIRRLRALAAADLPPAGAARTAASLA